MTERRISIPPILSFGSVTADQEHVVGDEATTISCFYDALRDQKVNIPNGFIITPSFFDDFIHHNDLSQSISARFASLDPSDLHRLFADGSKVRSAITYAEFPDHLQAALDAAHNRLESTSGPNPELWIRPSWSNSSDVSPEITGTDTRFLNISGLDNLGNYVRRCFASFFTDRAIAYRLQNKLDAIPHGQALVVQKMAHADRTSSGIMFTADPDSGWDQALIIDANYGLRNLIYRGNVVPDEFVLFKPMIARGYAAMLSRTLGSKQRKLVYQQDNLTGIQVREVRVPEADTARFCLNKARLLELGQVAAKIEEVALQTERVALPLAIEWAIDSISDTLKISRVEHLHDYENFNEVDFFSADADANQVIVRGRAIGRGSAQGRVRVMYDVAESSQIEEGDILVTTSLEPEWSEIIADLTAIIVENGGATSLGARLARKHGVPMLIAHEEVTRLFEEGETITINCGLDGVATAWRGPALQAKPQWRDRVEVNQDTPLMLCIDKPNLALMASAIEGPTQVTLNLEHIYRAIIGLHPDLAEQVAEMQDDTRATINRRIAGFKDLQSFMIGRIAESISTVAAAFYPKEVIVCLSNFTSADLLNFLGGDNLEQAEADPRLGLRGASRYLSKDHHSSFEYECKAIAQVREAYGFDNVSIMVPYVRSADEAQQLNLALNDHGLARNENGPRHILRCNLPVNLLLPEDFMPYYDGACVDLQDISNLTFGSDGVVNEGSIENAAQALSRLLAPLTKYCQAQHLDLLANAERRRDFELAKNISQNIAFSAIGVRLENLRGYTLRAKI